LSACPSTKTAASPRPWPATARHWRVCPAEIESIDRYLNKKTNAFLGVFAIPGNFSPAVRDWIHDFAQEAIEDVRQQPLAEVSEQGEPAEPPRLPAQASPQAIAVDTAS